MPPRAAPKDRKRNAVYRRAILLKAATDTAFREECWIRASRDLIWWCDTFAWTYSPKDCPDNPEQPFILWPGFQEEVLLALNAGIGTHDLLIDKSRDMGASWMCALVFFWRWQFRRRQTFLIVSRKEDLVDKKGDPDALFWKIDYLLETQPGWMQPKVNRTMLHIENLETKSTIDGDSTNSDLGRGGRRTAILLDEFAAVDNGHEILAATRDTTNCRIFNSTSKGTHTAHYAVKRRMKEEYPSRVLSLHWSKHPLKSKGLYTTVDGKEGSALRVIDAEYEFPPDYKFICDGKLRSPWYDDQCRRAGHPKEIAQELDMDDQEAGWSFFETRDIEALIDEFARPPACRGEMSFEEYGKRPEFFEQSGGRLQLWFTPSVEGKPPSGRYVVGCDVAMGKGGEMSSNSVASIGNRVTGEKVGQFASNCISPQDFVGYALALCRWLGDAFLIWEDNGPGGEFTKQLKECGYHNVFYREDEKKFGRKKTRLPGWYSSKDSKRILLSTYLTDLKKKKFINRCLDSLNECREYVMEPNGSIVHAKSKLLIDPTAAGENHGDMVIADACCNRGMKDVSREATPAEAEIPVGSYAYRRAEWKAKQKKAAVY